MVDNDMSIVDSDDMGGEPLTINKVNKASNFIQK